MGFYNAPRMSRTDKGLGSKMSALIRGRREDTMREPEPVKHVRVKSEEGIASITYIL